MMEDDTSLDNLNFHVNGTSQDQVKNLKSSALPTFGPQRYAGLVWQNDGYRNR
jgi:hypothetical protein